MIIQFLGVVGTNTSVVMVARSNIGCLNLLATEDAHCKDSGDHPRPATGILALQNIAS